MAFGTTIKGLRTKRKVSVQKIADAIGVDADRWRKWEEKDLNPREEDAKKIEAFFGMTLEEIGNLKDLSKFKFVPNRNTDQEDDLKTALSIIKDQNAFLQKMIETSLGAISNEVRNNAAAVRAEIRGYAHRQILKEVKNDDAEFLKAKAEADKIYLLNLKILLQEGNNNNAGT